MMYQAEAIFLRYEEITLESLDQVEGFKNLLLDSADGFDMTLTPKPIGHLVQRLWFSRDENFMITIDDLDLDHWEAPQVAKFVSSVHIILLCLPMIQYFDNPLRHQSVASKASQIATLSRISQDTLTSINISLPENDNGVFRAINTLRRLSCLEIHIDSKTLPVSIGHEQPPWTHDIRHPINVASLQHIVWRVYGQDLVSPYMLQFLGACRFAPRCTVELELEFMINDVPLLLPLFTENVVEKLVYAYLPTETQAIMAPVQVHIPQLLIYGYSPSWQLVRQKTLPQFLMVSYTDALVHGPDKEQQFWIFVHELQSIKHAFTQRRTIKVDGGLIRATFPHVSQKVKPVSQSRYAGFVQRLSPIAKELWSKNIHLIDGFEIDGAPPDAVVSA
jgi:hypothetical protein